MTNPKQLEIDCDLITLGTSPLIKRKNEMTNPKQLEAGRDLFSLLSSPLKIETLQFMRELNLATEGKAPVIEKEDSAEDVKEPTIEEWLAVYELTTLQSKMLTVSMVLSDMGRVFLEKVKRCKEDPGFMENLSLDDLRHVVGYEVDQVNRTIFDDFPKEGGVLANLAYLNKFKDDTDVPTAANLVEVKYHLLNLWSWQSDRAEAKATEDKASKPKRKQ